MAMKLRFNQAKLCQFMFMRLMNDYIVTFCMLPRGGGYSVERWVRGCAAQIGCIFSLTGFSMTPFYFKTRF